MHKILGVNSMIPSLLYDWRIYISLSYINQKILRHPQLIQHPLRAHNLALSTSHLRRSHPDSHSQSLKSTLSTMMIVVSSQAIDMQRHTCILRKTGHAMWNHFTTQITNLFSLQTQIYNAERTIGKVNYGAGESFVEGAVCTSETGKTGGRTERGFERSP
jgi:hypothetical protein